MIEKVEIAAVLTYDTQFEFCNKRRRDLMNRFLILTALVLNLLACTAIEPVEEHHSGYLDDYSDMIIVKTEDGSHAMRWTSPTVKRGHYKKIIVDPVVIFPAPRTSDKIKLDTLKQITAYLTQKLVSEQAKFYEVTDEAGSDTMHLQMAITGVDTPVEGLEVYEAIPIALVFAGASTAAGERDRVTVVYLEGLVTDSITGEVIARGLRQGVGDNLPDDDQEIKLSDIEKLLDGWAAEVSHLTSRLL